MQRQHTEEKWTRDKLYSAAEVQQFDLGESWPLSFGDAETGGAYFKVLNAEEFPCIEDDAFEDFEIQQRANAQRICALWNAALDLNLSTAVIETGMIAELIAACELALNLERLYANQYSALKVGNRENALRWLQSAGEINRKLRDAISKAKGE